MTPNQLKLGSTERTDDAGTYTAFHRTCRDCNVELTSRNRCGVNLTCKPCYAARARDNYISAPRPTPKRVSEAARSADPLKTKAHSLLTALLKHPTSVTLKEALLSHLMTVEIKALMH